MTKEIIKSRIELLVDWSRREINEDSILQAKVEVMKIELLGYIALALTKQGESE